MRSSSDETVPYAPYLPGTTHCPSRTECPAAVPPAVPQPRRLLDPFAKATNHRVRRPAPAAAAHPAPSARATAPPLDQDSSSDFDAELPPIPPDHPFRQPPRRVRGELHRATRQTAHEEREARYVHQASRRHIQQLISKMDALEAQRGEERQAVAAPPSHVASASAHVPVGVEDPSSPPEQQAASPSTRRAPSRPPSRAHDPPPQLDDTASSRAGKAPRLSVVHAGPSSGVYNTRSQGSAPAINVIGEPIQQHQPLLPMEPSSSDSDSAPDAAPEQH